MTGVQTCALPIFIRAQKLGVAQKAVLTRSVCLMTWARNQLKPMIPNRQLPRKGVLAVQEIRQCTRGGVGDDRGDAADLESEERDAVDLGISGAEQGESAAPL